jgi:phosphonatase-like hydrolase
VIELAVLDIAGTTVEEHQAVYKALAAATGVPVAEVAPWMGADKRTAVASLLPSASPSRVVEVYGDFRRRLAAAYAAQPPEPLPGVPAALAKLRTAGIQVALTTGFDREVASFIVSTLGWQETLDAVICSDDVPNGRPAPYMIFRAMEATGTRDVRKVLVAGDTVRDLEAGANSGAAMVVGVLTGGTDATTLGATQHTHILPSVAALPELLGI